MKAALLAAGKASPTRHYSDRVLKCRYSELLSSNHRSVASALEAEEAKLLTHKPPAPSEAKGCEVEEVDDDDSLGAAWAPADPPAPTRPSNGDAPFQPLGAAADQAASAQSAEIPRGEAKAEGVAQQQQRLIARPAAIEEKKQSFRQTEPARRAPVTTAAR